MTDVPLYRLDDLRRMSRELLTGVGLAPARASSLTGYMLWYDSGGEPRFGFATLPKWLDGMASGAIDASADGTVIHETAGTGLLDGLRGPWPLTLARAGELAVQKARDAGVGWVRVVNIGPSGPAAAVVSEIAIGPYAGFAVGPGPSWTMAFPSDHGLPAVYDSALRGGAPSPISSLAPWAACLLPNDGWFVVAFSVVALESLSTMQERVTAILDPPPTPDAWIAPRTWDAKRLHAREHGVPVTDETWIKLKPWTERSSIRLPEPTHHP